MLINNDKITKRFGYGKQLVDISPSPIFTPIRNVYSPEIEPDFPNQLGEYLQELSVAQKAKDQDTLKELTRKSFGIFIKERARLAINAPISFHEHLVHFWSNHFAISTDNRFVTICAGNYEFYAIRPNINGDFKQLLLAVITHPAMLVYLDQEKSVGPNSIAAKKSSLNNKEIGLNENLAREILELHTLGVKSGYTQKDVTEFAKALTGFSYKKPKDNNNDTGQFTFLNQRHEPNNVSFMGKIYAQSGQEQALAIIDDIVANPNTAGFIAYKLARHFCADNPPQTLVSRLKSEFIRTNGNLNSLYEVLINSEECFDTKNQKFKNPWEWFISSLRILGVTNIDAPTINKIMKILGQEILQPKSPKGYDDIQTAWAAPDALLKRAEIANLLCRNYLPMQNQDEVINKTFGQTLSEQTTKVLSRAESKQSALSLLLISPENMRR